MFNEGTINGKRLFPAAAVKALRAGGDPKKFGSAYPALVGGSYAGLWWVYPDQKPGNVIAARGVHGQAIYVDWDAEMVLVRFASAPGASNRLHDPTSLPAYRAVAAYLKGRSPMEAPPAVRTEPSPVDRRPGAQDRSK